MDHERIGKTNESLAFFKARLDQVQMNDHERLMAEAQFARAEAAVEWVAALIASAKRLLTMLVVRPLRRMTASTG